jgi:hypothetical protein
MSQLIPEKSPGKWQHEMTNVFVIEYILLNTAEGEFFATVPGISEKIPLL